MMLEIAKDDCNWWASVFKDVGDVDEDTYVR
jgi:hypothetical protein